MAVSNTIKVSITGDASSLTRAVKEASADVKALEKDAESSGSKMKAVWSGVKVAAVAAAAAAVAAIGSIGKSAVQNYAEYEQLVGGVETLFKESADQVETYANEAYRTAGLSANRYMEQATAFSASLLQSLGGDTKAAADYANTAMIDMADNANKMGTAIESIQNAYQGFAKQNYTMLDNLKLGYGGTKTEMERLITDAERMDSSFKAARDTNGDLAMSFSDIVGAIHIVQTEMGIAGTTAKEASTTIQGSVAAMKASWQNLLTGLAGGQDIGPLIENLVGNIETVFENLQPVIMTALNGVAELITRIAPIIAEKLPAIIDALLPPLLKATIQIALALVKALPSILTSIINAVVGFLTDPANIELIINSAIELFMAIVQAIPAIIGALISAFGVLLSRLWEAVKSIFGEFVAGFGEFLGGIFKGAINGVLSFIENFINAPIRLLNGFIGLINDAFGWIGVNIGQIGLVNLPRLEKGGVIPGNSYSGDQVLARVNSGEMVINREQQSALWSAIESGDLGGNRVGDVNVSVNVNGVSGSSQEIGDAVAVATVKAIRRAFKSQGVEPLIANAGVLR